MKLGNFYKMGIKNLFKVTRILFSKKKAERKALFELLKEQKKAITKRKIYEKKTGQHIPILLLISVTERCNLRCKGCYSHAIKDDKKIIQEELSIQDYKKIFDEASELGISLITLVGGEPLLRNDLIELATSYKNIIFSVYTNGILMTNRFKEIILSYRNIIPFFSLEGFKAETDERRGAGTYDILLERMDFMKDNDLFYGVSVTVSSNNYQVVTSQKFVDLLNNRGCVYISYVEFEAINENDTEMVLSKEARSYHNNTVRELSRKNKNIFFTSYPDFEYKTGGCLAAGRGFFHINAYGDAEPCNFIPNSDTNIKANSIIDCLKSPLFKEIQEARLLENIHDGECALLSKKEALSEIIKR